MSLKDLYNSGLSSWAIARRFDTHHSNILFHLDNLKVKRRDKSSAAKEGVKAGRIKIRKHRLPEDLKLDKNLAYILGVLCGDGYMDYNNKRMTYYIGLDVVDKDFFEEFKKTLYNFFKIKPTDEFKKSKNEKWKDQFITRLCSRAVCDYINNIGDFKRDRWRVPDMLKNSDKSVKGAFLRGYFDSEGNVDKGSRRVSAPSINLKGIKEIQFLLNDFGIRSKIELKERTGYLDIYVLKIQDRKSIELFSEYIGFSIKRKQRLLDDLIRSYKFTKILPEELKIKRGQILFLKEKGLKFGEIARVLNMNPTTVWKVYNE